MIPLTVLASAVATTSFTGEATSAVTYADRVHRTLRVVSRGFPVQINQGGIIDNKDTAKFTFEVSLCDCALLYALTMLLNM